MCVLNGHDKSKIYKNIVFEIDYFGYKTFVRRINECTNVLEFVSTLMDKIVREYDIPKNHAFWVVYNSLEDWMNDYNYSTRNGWNLIKTEG